MKSFYIIAWMAFHVIAAILLLTGNDYSQITMYLVLGLTFYFYARDE